MAISIGDAVLQLGVDTKDLEKGMKGVGATIKKHQKAIGIGMTAAGGAILAGLGMSLKAAVDFEGAMREVNTMMGLSQEEFTDFSKEVQGLASDLGVDAVDSAKALYQAISAGIPKENALEFLKIATEAAIGGVTDTETAVDGLTTVINAFKLPLSDTQKVADLMFQTVKGGKTTFEELSASLFQVAPIAAASGVSFEEVSAALATMTKQGVPTKVATTQLRQAMVSLQKPTKEMNEVIQGLGFESGQTMVNELGLAETLNTLRDATEGSNELLMKMFGSVEAGQAVLALTGDNAQMFAEDLDAMANSTGAATDAFEEMENSSSRQMAALKTSFKDVMITVGNVLLPILKDLLASVKPIIDSVRKWAEENPALTKVIVIVAGVIGSLLVVLGPLLIMLPGIIAFLPVLGAAFAVLTGPVGLVIAAIAGLIAIGVLVVKNWENIKFFFVGMWLTLVDLFKANWDKILAILFPFIGIPILIARNWGKIVEFFSGIWVSIKDIFFSNINSIIEKVNAFIGLINKIPGVNIGKIGLMGGEEEGGKLKGFAQGGMITEPTLLSSLRTGRPYAIAGEAGPEPIGRGSMITNNFSIAQLIVREEADVPRIARELYVMQQVRARGAGG